MVVRVIDNNTAVVTFHGSLIQMGSASGSFTYLFIHTFSREWSLRDVLFEPGSLMIRHRSVH